MLFLELGRVTHKQRIDEIEARLRQRELVNALRERTIEQASEQSTDVAGAVPCADPVRGPQARLRPTR